MKKSIVFLCILLCSGVPLMAQRGADISWMTEMEASGKSWKDACGQQADLLDILKAFNLNAIRLRVWVNPSGGWSGKDDVVNKALRAKNAGMDLMIAFHYSDSWADPGKQNKPSAWSSYGIDQLVDAVYNHTYDVMSALQSNGINPRWVGIGNETNNGMLWPDGRAEDHMQNYARLVTAGHNAVKATTGSTTIVHVSNGWDTSLFNWNIGGLMDNGASFDMVGMSLYPSSSDWSNMVSQARSTVSAMNSRGKNVIVCEVGMEVSAASACKSFITSVLNNLGSAFYWEPECMGWNGYSKGAWNSDGTPTIAMEAFGGSGCVSGSGSTPEPTSPPQVTPDPTQAPTQTLGDVNNDGEINIVDALLVAQDYVGLNPANFDRNRADVNCDGSVNIVDALLIAQYYVGLVSSFCVP